MGMRDVLLVWVVHAITGDAIHVAATNITQALGVLIIMVMSRVEWVGWHLTNFSLACASS